MDDDTLQAQLDRVAAYEAGRRKTVVNRVLQRVGPTRPFVAVYRRLGPRIDPWLNRITRGKAATKIYGFPALILVSTGAKSGKPRTSPLVYVRDGDDFVVVGTNFGTEHHPGWTYNLDAEPTAEIVVGEETIPVTAERADGAAFDRLWPAFVTVYAGMTKYRERLDREARMYLLHPTVR